MNIPINAENPPPSASNTTTPHVKKVLLLCDFFSSLGGTEYYNAALATGLKQRGYDVRIYIGEKPHLSHWTKYLDTHHIPHSAPDMYHESLLDSDIERAFIEDKIEEINSWEPDIIHVHPFGKTAIAWLKQPVSNKEIPIIATEWTTASDSSLHWFNPEMNDYFHKVAAYIATCDAVSQGLRQFHGYNGDIRRIPHLLTPADSVPAHTIKTRMSVGCVSRLSVEKGLDFMIGAWLKVHQAYPQASLHVYGHGPELAHLTQLRDCLGLKDVIHFDGVFEPYTGINQVAARHSIFVQPSLFESIPTSLIELMLRGRVMVASRVGGIPEILTADNGILIEPASSDEIAESLMKLLCTPKLVKKLGRSAGAIRSTYDYTSVLDAICNLYQDVASSKKTNKS